MSLEKPVSLLKQKKSKLSKTERTCIIHNVKLSNYREVKKFTEVSQQKICDSKLVRLQNDNPKFRQSEICAQIPETRNDENHGYHRPCYQVFTNLRDCRKRHTSDNRDETNSPKKRRIAHQKGTLLPQDTCLICCRKKKYVKRKAESLIQCVTETAKNSITQAARLKSDNRIISLSETHCFIAQQARYHESCRKMCVRNENRHTASSSTTDQIKVKNNVKKLMPKVSYISVGMLKTRLQKTAMWRG